MHNCPVAHPMCTKQILKLFNYELKYYGDSNEINEECFHVEQLSLLEKLKNFKLIDLTEIVISIVRLYQNDPSLKAFILYQVLREAVSKRFKLDPTLHLLSYLYVLRSINEMIEECDNLQVLPLPFDHVFECEKNVLVLREYFNVLMHIYSSVGGMESVLWISIAKSTIPTLLKIENSIPNVEKTCYYTQLSRLAFCSHDLSMERVYVQKAKQFREEHDKVYPYTID